MNHRVITISRQLGSGGREIGEKLAKKLGFAYYDKALIDLAAEKGQIQYQTLEKADEKTINPLFQSYLNERDQIRGRGYGANDVLFKLQSEIIKDIASKEDCVIIGRSADYILKKENCKLLSVFIHAPFQSRVKRTYERKRIIERDVIALIKRTDKQRKHYYEYYTDNQWGDLDNYDMAINSKRWGIENSVEVIAKAAEIAWLD